MVSRDPKATNPERKEREGNAVGTCKEGRLEPLSDKPRGQLLVHEVYKSIQGESVYAGLPCVLCGSPLAWPVACGATLRTPSRKEACFPWPPSLRRCSALVVRLWN